MVEIKFVFLKELGKSNSLRWQKINESQKLLKSTEKYFSLSWAKVSKKKWFLVKSEILGLLVNKGEFTATNSNAIIWKSKNILLQFCCIFEINIIYGKMSLIA